MTSPLMWQVFWDVLRNLASQKILGHFHLKFGTLDDPPPPLRVGGFELRSPHAHVHALGHGRMLERHPQPPPPPARIGSGSRPGARDLWADLGTPPQPPQFHSPLPGPPRAPYRGRSDVRPLFRSVQLLQVGRHFVVFSPGGPRHKGSARL